LIPRKYGSINPAAPTTVEGIEKYLGSGMIRGIGPVYAKKLVRAFGEKVFEVIEQEPSRLREMTGIGPKRAERIYKTYGADAIRLISETRTAWPPTSAASAFARPTRSRPSLVSKRRDGCGWRHSRSRPGPRWVSKRTGNLAGARSRFRQRGAAFGR
jgi:ATP-dependent exoDNAse (exonuclease V) alpha subunit